MLKLAYMDSIFSVRGDYEIEQNISLSCNAQDQDLKKISWYYNYGWVNQQHVTTWTHGHGSPSDSGQWLGRTELNTDTGATSLFVT